MIRIFHHYINARVMLQMAVDFGLVLLALLFLSFAIAGDRSSAAAIVSHGSWLAVWTLVAGGLTGIYRSPTQPTLQRSAVKAFLATLLIMPLAYGIGLLLGQSLSVETMTYAALGSAVSVIAFRSVSAHLGAGASTRARILVVGTGPVALQVKESLLRCHARADVVGFFPSPNETQMEVPRSQVLAGTQSLAVTAANARVDEVVVALTERRAGSMSLRDLLDCKIRGIRVSDLSTHFEKRMGQIKLDYVNAGWLIFGDGFNQGFWRTTIKRASDLFCSIVLLLVALPVMLVTMVLIKLESAGPVFFRQERVGLNGRSFNVIKFRSMRNDAEEDGQPRWATASDDRVTRVGRLIRKVRIDELPQLWNVFKGEMSLVGPRPERPYFVDTLTKDIPYYSVRHSVKPGITGWAQVRFDYGATVEDAKQKLQYDLYYVKNHTLFLDLMILFETVSVVLTGKGAR